MISLYRLENIPIIQSEEELWECLLHAVSQQARNGDILVCAHTPFSRILGPIFDLNKIKASDEAIGIAKEIDKTPEKID